MLGEKLGKRLLAMLGEKAFSETRMGGVTFIGLELNTKFPRSHLLPSDQGKSPAMSSIELGLKPVSRVSAAELHSPLQHQLAQFVFPAVVHYV